MTFLTVCLGGLSYLDSLVDCFAKKKENWLNFYINGATKTHTAKSLNADSIVVTFVLLIHGMINTWLGKDYKNLRLEILSMAKASLIHR